jgi:hypothetical protein
LLIQLSPGQSDQRSQPFKDPNESLNSALAAQKRPERLPGLTATNAAHLIPDAIRKRFAQGWKQHVPLHYLTDSYYSHDNAAVAKDLDDT